MKKVLFLFFLCYTVCLSAQISLPNKEEAYRELQKKGLSIEEFESRMSDLGYDIDNIDPLTVNLSQLETDVETVVRQMEQEKAAADVSTELETAQDSLEDIQSEIVEEESTNMANASAERIKQLVDSGVPLEEAIARDLIEAGKEDLPETRIFGQHIFRNKDIDVYNSAVDIRPPDNYVLGVGDKITVLIWGASLENATFEINKSGYIQPSGMQRINLKGVTYAKAKTLLSRRFAQNYRFRPEEFEVTIDNARTITVNVIGEAINSGSFNLPALNTAFNALAAANGPSDLGSVRNIKLIHANGNSQTLDVYEFLLNPAIVKDYFLENNDYIFIPVAEKVVTIEGAINRPFMYELKDNEGIIQLIEYAGGLKENAIQQNVQVKRFELDKEIIINVNVADLYNSRKEFALKKGDVVTVDFIEKSYENFALVEGAVELPGEYEITPNMRFSDLIQKAQLAKDAKLDDAFIRRKRSDGQTQTIRINIQELLDNPNTESNQLLNNEDELIVFSQSNFIDEKTFIVSGAVRLPGEHPFDPNENIRVEDAIIIGGGITNEATDFAYIHRRDPETRKLKEYVRVNLRNALNNPSSEDNISLRPFDSLVVYNYKEFLDKAYIKVSGAVRNPGEFKYDETISLKDALTLSGGLRLDAAYSRIDVSSLVIDSNNETETIVTTLEVDKDLNILGNTDFRIKPYDLIYVRQAPEFEFQRSVTLKGEVRFPGTHSLIADNERVDNIIKRAGGLTNEAFPEGATLYRVKDNVGYVVMDLKEVLKNTSSINNFILKEGDIIEIPKRKDFVSITGATKAKELYPDKILRTGRFNVPHHKTKNAKWYIDEYAAGIGEDGRRRLITVEHANGQIERTKNYILFQSYPKVKIGSTITVGKVKRTPEQEKKEREEIDWGRVLADSITQATAVLSLILLVQRVN